MTEVPDDFALARAGDRSARERICTANDGLVVSIASYFGSRSPGYEIDDLAQEARMAMWWATKCFRPTQGIKFNTYAGECIKRRLGTMIKDRRHKPLTQLHVRGDDDPSGLAAPTEEAGDHAELMERIPVALREVVRLRLGIDCVDGQNLTWAEIGQRIGLPAKAARSQYLMAVGQLRTDVN